MTYSTILYDESDGVGTITLNRPERMNAFNLTMGEEFGHVWNHIRDEAAIKAVVLRAAGDRAFCTGVDVKEGGWSRDKASPFDRLDPGTILGPKQNRIWKPFICAIHGMAAGGAFYWINEADIVICSDDAEFFDPHVSYGQVSAVEPAGMLGRIPYGEIMRMVLLGNDERIVAQTALRIGLVSEVVERASLWARAAELAKMIAEKPAAATQGSVRAVWESRSLPHGLAVSHALKYCQLGNPIGRAEIDRSTVRKSPANRR